MRLGGTVGDLRYLIRCAAGQTTNERIIIGLIYHGIAHRQVSREVQFNGIAGDIHAIRVGFKGNVLYERVGIGVGVAGVVQHHIPGAQAVPRQVDNIIIIINDIISLIRPGWYRSRRDKVDGCPQVGKTLDVIGQIGGIGWDRRRRGEVDEVIIGIQQLKHIITARIRRNIFDGVLRGIRQTADQSLAQAGIDQHFPICKHGRRPAAGGRLDQNGVGIRIHDHIRRSVIRITDQTGYISQGEQRGERMDGAGIYTRIGNIDRRGIQGDQADMS